MTEYPTYPSVRGRVAFVGGGASGLGADSRSCTAQRRIVDDPRVPVSDAIRGDWM